MKANVENIAKISLPEGHEYCITVATSHTCCSLPKQISYEYTLLAEVVRIREHVLDSRQRCLCVVTSRVHAGPLSSGSPRTVSTCVREPS